MNKLVLATLAVALAAGTASAADMPVKAPILKASPVHIVRAGPFYSDAGLD